jgi:hypothetical protein
MIKEALRQAIRNTVEECIDPHDPIFTAPPSAKRTGKQENVAVNHDKYLYSASSFSST